MKLKKNARLAAWMLTVCLCMSLFAAYGLGAAASNDAGEPMHTMKITGTTTWNSVIKTVDYAEYPIWDVVNEALLSRGLQLEVEIIPIDQMQVVAQTRLAAAVDLPDVMHIGFLDKATQISFANQGMFIPLQDVLEYSDGTARDFYTGPGAYAVKLNTFENGNTYWYTSYLSTVVNGELKGNSYTVLIRKDWLEQLDIPVPETAEDFFDAMKAFRDNDANGNGMADEILAIAPYFNNSINGWFGIGSELVYVDPQSQEVLTPWYQEGVKEYIEYLKRFVDEGIFDVTAYERVTEINTDNKLGAMNGYGTTNWMGPQVNTGDAPEAEHLPIGPLTTSNPALTPRGTGDAAVMLNTPFAVTKGCDDLEAVAIFLDFITSDEYAVLGEWGIEGYSFEVVDGERQMLYTDRQEMEDKRVSNMFWLFGNAIFPRMNLNQDLVATNATIPDYQMEYMINFPDNTLLFGNNETIYMAIPTEEELATISEIYTDLSTYSEETFLKLLLGQLSMDNWDTYISELKALGLDTYLEIMTDRYHRYIEP